MAPAGAPGSGKAEQDKASFQLVVPASEGGTSPPLSPRAAAAAEEAFKPVPLFGRKGLFRFADKVDVLLMLLGTVFGLASGAALPAFSLLLGDLYTDFNSSLPDDAILAAGVKYAKLFSWVALGAAVAGFGQVAFFTLSSERQTLRVRKAYLASLLRQDIAWFDTSRSGEHTASIAENSVVIREAMGEKLGALFMNVGMCIFGLALGFSLNWSLTLVVMSATPLLALGGYMFLKTMEDATTGGLKAYSKAGGVAEEAFSLIRTVAGLGAERRIADRYQVHLNEAEAHGMHRAKGQGVAMGITFGVYFLSVSSHRRCLLVMPACLPVGPRRFSH
jgi:ATP-binding cassette subfamily B (MDR/TAP) protein 1